MRRVDIKAFVNIYDEHDDYDDHRKLVLSSVWNNRDRVFVEVPPAGGVEVVIEDLKAALEALR